MSGVTISPKYQIVTPKAVRDRLHLVPGQKLAMLVEGRTISMVRVRPTQELKGIAKGASMEGHREEEDEERWPASLSVTSDQAFERVPGVQYIPKPD
jgi:AbrB family looped-hinge helix DNA binding protein